MIAFDFISKLFSRLRTENLIELTNANECYAAQRDDVICDVTIVMGSIFRSFFFFFFLWSTNQTNNFNYYFQFTFFSFTLSLSLFSLFRFFFSNFWFQVNAQIYSLRNISVSVFTFPKNKIYALRLDVSFVVQFHIHRFKNTLHAHVLILHFNFNFTFMNKMKK